MDASVGPIRVEVIKGLEQVRVIVEPNEWGIELDAVYDGFSEAHLESRHFDRQFARVTFDSTRFAQVGSWTGTLKVGDREVGSPRTAGGGRATVRGASARWASPSRPASGPPTPRAGSSGSTRRCGSRTTPWSPSSRSGRAASGSCRTPTGSSRSGSGREAEWLGRPEHELRFAPGTRTVTGATLSYFGAHGEKTAEVEVETLLAFPLLLGSGYGLEPDWKHGMYQGDLVVQGQTVPPADPTYTTWALTEYAARFTYDGQVGYGMFECAVMGPTSSTASPAGTPRPLRPRGRRRRTPSHPVAPRTTPTARRRRRTKSSSASRVQGTLCSQRRPAVQPEPTRWSTPAARRAASHTAVSAPCSGVRSSGPMTWAKPGRPYRMPGVSAHPGCMAWKGTPVPAQCVAPTRA